MRGCFVIVVVDIRLLEESLLSLLVERGEGAQANAGKKTAEHEDANGFLTEGEVLEHLHKNKWKKLNYAILKCGHKLARLLTRPREETHKF